MLHFLQTVVKLPCPKFHKIIKNCDFYIFLITFDVRGNSFVLDTLVHINFCNINGYRPVPHVSQKFLKIDIYVKKITKKLTSELLSPLTEKDVSCVHNYFHILLIEIHLCLPALQALKK